MTSAVMLVRLSSALTLSQWWSSLGIQHCSLAVSSAVARLRKSLRSYWSSRWGRLLMLMGYLLQFAAYGEDLIACGPVGACYHRGSFVAGMGVSHPVGGPAVQHW